MAFAFELKSAASPPSWLEFAVVFLFGANSMLGWSVLRAGGLPNVVPFVNGFTRAMPAGIDRGLHLDDELAVHQLFARERPRLIVHCAGICNVEKCETSPEFAHSVNVEGARILADHAPADTRIVYCSSDHVFSGDTGPYREDSPTDPLTVYGRTRVAAEKILLARPNTLVLRAGLWIGPSATGRIGHLDWLRYRHSRNLPMTLVADEFRSAVWATDAARRVAAFAQSSLTGIRHIVAARTISRPDLARYLADHYRIPATLDTMHRTDRRVPHLGHVRLTTRHTDPLAAPLPPVIPDDLDFLTF